MNSNTYNISAQPMLNAAIKAARKAGSVINRAGLDLVKVQSQIKEDGSWVTDIDAQAQQEILQVLQPIYPNHQFVAEEADFNNYDNSKEYTWFIDPIDGTSNFIHGFGHYAISIAVLKNNNLEHALIYNPYNDELFTASRGRGAFLNNKRLRVSNKIKLLEALIATSFLHKKNLSNPKDVEQYLRIAQIVSGVRRTGSIALDLAYVAAGRFDAFFDNGIYSWDMAAGILLIKEAGGLASNFSGNSSNDMQIIQNQQLLVGNPKIFAALLPYFETK